MIESVSLEDWKSHKSNTLEFSSGINALVGEMGSGKSSVLEAITFALFGTLPSIQNRTIGLDDLIRRSPTERDTATVTVRFTHQNTNYKVMRTIKRGKGTKEAKIYEEGDLIGGPQASEVTTTVENILSIDYDLFASIIFAQQNQLDQFLSLTPAERKDEIDRLLKLDKFESARSNAVTLRNQIKTRQKDRKEDLEQLKERIDDDEIEQLEEKVKQIEEELQEQHERRKNLEERKTALEKEKQEHEKLREKHEKLDKRHTKLQAKIENLKETLSDEPETDSKKEAEEKRDEIKNKIEEVQEKKEEIEGLKKDLERIEEQQKTIKQDIKELQKKAEEREQLEEIETQLEQLREKLEEINDRIASIQTEKDQIDDSLSNLSTASQTCPTCGQELTDEHRVDLLQEYKNRKNELSETLEKYKQKKETVQDDKQELEKKRKKLLTYGEVEEKLEEKEKERQETDEHKEEVEQKLEQLEEDFSTDTKEKLEERYEQLKNDIEYFETRQRINETKEKREEIEKKLNKLNFDRERLENLQEELSDVKSDFKVIKNTISSKKELLTEKKKRLNELKDERDQQKQLQEEIEKYDRLRDRLNQLETALEQTQEEMRNRFVENANDTMQRVWDHVYPYDDYTSIRLRAGNDYILEVKDNRGDWYSVQGEVSGGERHTAALALRIALSLVLTPGLKLLILDEPTHNLDDRAIDDMADTLRTSVADLVDQLFLITHDEELEAAVTGTLYHLNKKDTSHGMTEVKENF